MGKREQQRIASDRLRVYVCHPFGSDPIVHGARTAWISKGLVDAGFFPLAPTVYFPQFIDEGTDRSLALTLAVQMMALANEVWVFADLGVSAGMEAEILLARQIGIPIRWATDVRETDRAHVEASDKPCPVQVDLEAWTRPAGVGGAQVPVVRVRRADGILRYETIDSVEVGSYLRAVVRIDAAAPLLADATVDRMVGRMIRSMAGKEGA